MKRYPLIVMAMALTFGIVLGYGGLLKILFAIVGLFCLAGFFYKKRRRDIMLISFCVLLGYGCVWLKIASYGHDLSINRGDFSCIGTIDSDIKERQGLNSNVVSFELNVERIKTEFGWKKRASRVLVNVYQNDLKVFYGQRLYLMGRLAKPYDFSTDSNFSYSKYLSRQGIFHILHVARNDDCIALEDVDQTNLIALSLKLRERLKKVFDHYLSIQESAMMNAFLLGDRSQITGSLKQMFVETGTAHILAISGLNVSIVAYIILLLLKIICLNRRLRFVLTIVLLIFYALMTGASPSVVRATVMAVIFLTAFLLERETDSLNLLFAAAFFILLMNPSNLFDIGFQLSFTCVFAIIEIYPVMKKSFFKIPSNDMSLVQKIMIDPLCLSLCVWICVLGLIAYYFKIVTPITVLANLVIVPLSSLIVALGMGLLLLCLFPLIGNCFAICLKLTLNALVGLVYIFNQVPAGHFYTPRISFYTMALFYAGLTFLFIWFKRSIQKSSFVDKGF